MVRGERLIKRRDSWFFAKAVEAVRVEKEKVEKSLR